MRAPFDLADDASYRRWRAWKLAHHPASVEALMVDVGDPRALTAAERAALLERIARANMALYRSPVVVADKQLPSPGRPTRPAPVGRQLAG